MGSFKQTDTEAKMTYLVIFLLFQCNILQQGDATPQVVSAWEPPCVSAMVSCVECEDGIKQGPVFHTNCKGGTRAYQTIPCCSKSLADVIGSLEKATIPSTLSFSNCGPKACNIWCKKDEQCHKDTTIACRMVPCCPLWSCVDVSQIGGAGAQSKPRQIDCK